MSFISRPSQLFTFFFDYYLLLILDSLLINHPFRTDKSLFAELQREAASDLLQFVVAVVARVDLDTSLGTAERHVDAGALERHQGRQGLNLVDAHLLRITNTYLGKRKKKAK